MTDQRKNTGNNYRKIRLTFGLLAIFLIFGELGVLLYVRHYLPSGIAPAVFYHEAPAGLFNADMYTPLDSGYPEIRAAIEKDLGDISNLPAYDISRLLRDWTRKQTNGFAVEINSRNPTEIYELIQSGYKAHCEPLAILLDAALSIYGIPSRRIDLFAEFGNFHKAHTSLEAWDGSQWYLCDPSFNSIVTDSDGNLLTAAEIQDAYALGKEIFWVQDATPTDPDIDGSLLPADELFKNVIYRVRVQSDDISRPHRIILAFFERLTGKVDSVIISKEGPFIPVYIIDGRIDRVLLALAVIFLLIASLPMGRSVEKG
ncbi:MAG: hypothetical protein NTY09_13880 [bacterium]|nr:hypothetical protein [bacterium]